MCVRVLGPEHRNTLIARNLAYWSGVAGDAVAARDQFTELVPVYVQVLGAEHRDTLMARSSLARWSGEAGDAVAARDHYAELTPAYELVFGPEHRSTLIARMNLAYWAGEASDPIAACELTGQLLVTFTGLTDLPAGLQAATASTLVRNLRRMPAVSLHQPADITDLGLVGLLQAAVSGSAEALVRLPSELVPIVESLWAEELGRRTLNPCNSWRSSSYRYWADPA